MFSVNMLTNRRRSQPLRSDRERMMRARSNRCTVLREIASLETHAISYFKAVLTTQNKSLLNPVLSALEYAVKTQNEELKKMVSSANNTSTKKQAQQAHSKVTKKQRQESASHALQMQRLMKGNPSKTLQLSLKRAKDTIQSIRQPSSTSAVSAGTNQTSSSSSTLALAPRSRQTTNDEDSIEIRFPRPENGALMYGPQEAVNNMWHAFADNPGRKYADQYKQGLIDKMLVPVQRTQLNKLLRDHGGPGKPMANLFWNSKGRPNTIEYDALVHQFRDTKRIGKGWSWAETKAAILQARKSKLDEQGIDTSLIKDPAKATVDAYHSALMSSVGVSVRACASKSAYREAGETSQRNMLTNTGGILTARCYVAASKEGIPLEYRFDESKASQSAIEARAIYAEAAGVPPQAVEFSPRILVTNQDDMSVIYDDFTGQGNDGNPGETERMLVDMSENNNSYGVHNSSIPNGTKKFNGQKMRLTTLMGACGNIGSVFVQLLNFTEDEMPTDKVPNGC